MNKQIAEKAGLVFTGKNFYGENEFIGTDKQWSEAERLDKGDATEDETDDLQEKEQMGDEQFSNEAPVAGFEN